MGRRRKVRLTTVKASDVEHLARRAFRKAGEHTKDAGVFWCMAALLHVGKISEYEFTDPFEALATCQVNNKPAYVRSCFRDLLRKRGADADAMLRSVRIVPACPDSAPVK